MLELDGESHVRHGGLAVVHRGLKNPERNGALGFAVEDGAGRRSAGRRRGCRSIDYGVELYDRIQIEFFRPFGDGRR